MRISGGIQNDDAFLRQKKLAILDTGIQRRDLLERFDRLLAQPRRTLRELTERGPPVLDRAVGV